MSWRDTLPIHPAAAMFPLLDESELGALADDIKKNGIRIEIILWADQGDGGKVYLLDGRNRLDAAERAGVLHIWDDLRQFSVRRPDNKLLKVGVKFNYGTDPYAIVASLNIHRRHLMAEQKRELIEKVLKIKTELSDRQIGKIAKVDHKTVATARTQLEGRGEIPHVETRQDAQGRNQPATKSEDAKRKARRKARQAAEKRKQDAAWNELRAYHTDDAIDARTTATAKKFFDQLGPELSKFIVEETNKYWDEYIPIINKLEKLVAKAVVGTPATTAPPAPAADFPDVPDFMRRDPAASAA